MCGLMQRCRGFVCWVLVLVMLLTICPYSAFAAENELALSVSVANVSETGATLTVTDNGNISGTKFAVYKVQEKSEEAPQDATGFTDFIYTWDGSSATTTLSSLEPDTEYVVYAAIAYFADGSTSSSAYTEMVSAEFTTEAEAAALSVSVANVSETGATLTVTDNGNISGTKFAVYKVQEKSEEAPDDATQFTDFIYTWDGASATTSLSNLTPGTEYVVYAAIAYFEGSGSSSAYTELVSAEFTTEAEAAPLSVSVTDIGETGATLTITDENSIAGTKFAVYKVQEKSEAAPDDATQFTDFIYTWDGTSATTSLSNLTPGTEYVVYAAIAYFDAGSAAYTELVSMAFKTSGSGGERPAESGGMSLSYRTDKDGEPTIEEFADYTEAVNKMNGLDESYSDVVLTLLGDINAESNEAFTGAIIINRTCTLDLNGFTLTVQGAPLKNVCGIFAEGDLTFTLTDSSASQEGTLVFESDYTGNAVQLGDYRWPTPEGAECDVRFVMNGGRIKAYSPASNSGQTAIGCSKFATVTVNDGDIEGFINVNGKFTLNGGSVEASCPTGVVGIVGDHPQFIMTGGSIRNTDVVTALKVKISAVQTYDGIKGDIINITGGTLSTINGSALYLVQQQGYSGNVHVGGDAELTSENGASITYNVQGMLQDEDYVNLTLDGDVLLSGGSHALEIGEDYPDHRTISVGSDVSMRYPAASIPVLPNSSFVSYPEGMVVDVTPALTETVNGVVLNTYNLARKDELGQSVGSEQVGYQYFDDLNTAIDGAAELYEAGNGSGTYSSELWSAFTAAYEAAFPILENENANQNEINYFTTQLGAAQAEMISDAENSVDLENLADGTYTVNVEVWNSPFTQLSMANGAVEPVADLTIKDGVGTITLTLKPIIQLGRWGSLMQFWTYKGTSPEEAMGNSNSHVGDSAYITEAEYPSWQRVNLNSGDITPILGEPPELPALENDIRPGSVRITLPYIGNSGDRNKVFCRVGVDMMRSLGGVGDQNCTLYIKYSALKAEQLEATLSTKASEVSLLQGGTQNIGATVTGDTGWALSYKSSNPSIATVDGDGTIHGVGEGTDCVITVTAQKSGSEPMTKTVNVKVAVAGATALQPQASGSTVTISGDTIVTNLEDVEVSHDRITVESGNSSSKVTVYMAPESVAALAASGRDVVLMAGPGRVELNLELLDAMSRGESDHDTVLTFNKVSIPTFEDENIDRNEFNAAYELTLKQNGYEVDFQSGEATVFVPWSARYGYAYYVEDGELKDVQNMTVSDDMASWSTEHFSVWALSEKSNLMEKVGIQEGVYSVPIRVRNASSPSQTSMAEEAMGEMVVADVREDEVIYTMFLRARVGDELGGEPIRGHLIEMRYYHPDDTERTDPILATVVREYQDRDMYGNIDTFPREIEVVQEGEPQSQYYIWVAVDAMGGTSQPQDALVRLDWDNALDDGGEAAREGFEDEYAIEQVIDSGDSVSRSDLEDWIDNENILLVQGRDDDLTARFDTDALEDLYDQTSSSIRFVLEEVKTSKLTDEQQETASDRPVYQLKLTSGGDDITDIGDGNVEVTFPYELDDGEIADGLVIWLMDEDSDIRSIKCSYSERNKTVSFDTTEFGVFVIGYDAEQIWENPFIDVKEEDWFYGAVKYVVQKGLFAGTSETTFEPNLAMTRGMLVTVLYRLEGTPAVTGSSTYADVAPGQYYTSAVIWATQNGIVSGYGNGYFGTNDIVSREQVATILFRYAKSKEYDTSLVKDIGGFTDSDQVASYAKRAMQWAYANGIIGGTSGTTLSPKGSATRAQVATILMRFDEKIIVPAQEKAEKEAAEAEK